MARFKIGNGVCSCPSWYAQHRKTCPLHPNYVNPAEALAEGIEEGKRRAPQWADPEQIDWQAQGALRAEQDMAAGQLHQHYLGLDIVELGKVRTVVQQIKDLRRLAKYATREADRLERDLTDSREQ